MLFSCLSLNIFAAEGDEAVATGAEEAVLTEAEKYQQYGVGLPGKYSLSVEDFEKLLAEAKGTAIVSGELVPGTLYNAQSKPFGLSMNDWYGMWIEAGDDATTAVDEYYSYSNNKISVTSSATNPNYIDIPILDWVGKSE